MGIYWHLQLHTCSSIHPRLVKLLRAFLARDAREMVNAGRLERVLAIVQQRLVSSKINDGWGFELLEGVVRGVDP